MDMIPYHTGGYVDGIRRVWVCLAHPSENGPHPLLGIRQTYPYDIRRQQPGHRPYGHTHTVLLRHSIRAPALLVVYTYDKHTHTRLQV